MGRKRSRQAWWMASRAEIFWSRSASMAKFGAHAGAEHERQRGKQRRHRRHENRAEAEEARLEDRFARRLSFIALCIEGEVDHHDRVLLHDADEHEDADKTIDVEFHSEEQEGNQCAASGGGQAGKDGDGMDEALVKDT